MSIDSEAAQQRRMCEGEKEVARIVDEGVEICAYHFGAEQSEDVMMTGPFIIVEILRELLAPVTVSGL